MEYLLPRGRALKSIIVLKALLILSSCSLSEQSTSFSESHDVAERSQNKDEQIVHFLLDNDFIYPVPALFLSRGASFGQRGDFVQIPVREGMHIVASLAGEVMEVQQLEQGQSASLLLRHDQDVKILYSGLQNVYVQEGQRVIAGQIIATAQGIDRTDSRGRQIEVLGHARSGELLWSVLFRGAPIEFSFYKKLSFQSL